MGGLRRKPLTCRKGLPNRGIFLIFSMRGFIFIIVKTLEPFIIQQIVSNKGTTTNLTIGSEQRYQIGKKQKETAA